MADKKKAAEVDGAKPRKKSGTGLGGDNLRGPDGAPWPSPVDIGEVLDDLASLVRRYVVLTNEAAVAVALWITFTWLIEHADIAPILLITAPEKRCGKSRLLELMRHFARRAILVSNITSGGLLRVVDQYQPTLLIDEADSFFHGKEELRGILNSGHTRAGAGAVRCVGDHFVPNSFSSFCPKAIAGIGRVAGTIEDRSIVIVLHRKLTSEMVEPLRFRMEDSAFVDIPRKLARFAEDAGEMFSKARPHVPTALHDRAKDNWEPLIAIADLAGGAWPAKARSAAVALHRCSDQEESLGLELLRDVRRFGFQTGEDRVTTAHLLERLTAIDGAPWCASDGELTDRRLSRTLAPYGVRPTKLRISGGSPVQGYFLKSVENACVRYLGGNPDEVPNGDTGTVAGVAGAPDRAAEHATSGTDKPLKRKGCSGVPANRDIDTIDMEEIWNRPVPDD